MEKRALLLIDAAVNLVLGVVLVAYSPRLADFLGLPQTAQSFYPNILGAVFIGITIALAVQAFRKNDGPVGLGPVGALAINLCGAIVLAVWLLAGTLDLPLRGRLLLWILDAGLGGISVAELLAAMRRRGKRSDRGRQRRSTVSRTQ
jgi:hypothetical protein